MKQRIALFWPGDARDVPNQLAYPNLEHATVQMEKALKKLGHESYRIEGFISKPYQSIEKLGPIDDPLIAVCVHWFYGTHTTDGVVGKDNPLLLASNFSGQWPGLVGLLNTGACLESVERKFSRIWTDQADFSSDSLFMERLRQFCTSGRITYSEDGIHYSVPLASSAVRIAKSVALEFRRRRALVMMLGDTSMGMINGYFGPRLLAKHYFSEHKIDQAWIIERGSSIRQRRIDDAFAYVKDKGVHFHWKEEGAEDFGQEATKEQLRDYLSVVDMVKDTKADCIGWQYQLGLLSLRPPSDFAEGLLNSTCRPETDGDTVVCATEADQGNVIPMEMMKRLLKVKGLHQAVMFHDVRWGAEVNGRFIWVLLNSGSCGAFAFNHDASTLKGVHSYRQPSAYFPVPGGTFTGESLPGKITWSRCYIKKNALWMDIGYGEALALPPEIKRRLWEGTTRQWPFMAADIGVDRDTFMAHYLSNHIAVAYGDIFEEMVSLSLELGFRIRILRTV